MEKIPSLPHAGKDAGTATASLAEASEDAKSWRDGVPTLAGTLVTLRELRASDASSLFLALSADAVTRFISPPPPSIEGFEKFIAWTHLQRTAGQYACFAIVPQGSDAAFGLFQIRSLEPAFGTAEWGFALAPELWGNGSFGDGARMAIRFAFETLGTHRLEARASVANGRGNAALQKLGASCEGILRRSLLRHGEYHDQALWTIRADQWRDAHLASGTPPTIH